MNLNQEIDTSKLKDTAVNFIIPLISLGITLLVGLLVILPSVRNMPNLRAELDSTSRLESQLRDKLRILNSIVEFQDVVNEHSSVVSRTLVSDPSVPELLTQVDTIARESGLAVTRLSYSFGETTPEEATLPYSVVNVSLGALGSYEQINNFMRSLENSARVVNTNTFRFSSEATDAGDGIFNLTVILQSPYLNVVTNAVTDDPVNLDVTDPEFTRFIERISQLRFYDVSAVPQFEDVQESSPEEIEQSVTEDVVPEGEVNLEQVIQ